jgi:hypothetical protein
MTKTNKGGQRLPWTTPQLRRIEAGSAEAGKPGGQLDNGAAPLDKS